MAYRFTAADRGLIVTALRHLGGTEADALVDRMLAAPATEPKPLARVEPFEPATGDADLDAWMRAHHRDDWQARNAEAFRARRVGMIPMPTVPRPRPHEVGSGTKALTSDERSALWRAHGVRQVSA